MANATTRDADQPAEPVRRAPADGVWFAVLALSVATGIGMTIFAPIGDEAPPPSLAAPAIKLLTTEPSSTAPSTAPIP